MTQHRAWRPPIAGLRKVPLAWPRMQGMAILALVSFFCLAAVLASVLISGLLRDSWQMHGAADQYVTAQGAARDLLQRQLLAQWASWQRGETVPTDIALSGEAATLSLPASSSSLTLQHRVSHQGFSIRQAYRWQSLMPGWPSAMALTPQGRLSADGWQTASPADSWLLTQLFGAPRHVATLIDRAQRTQSHCDDLPATGGMVWVRGHCVLPPSTPHAPLLLLVEAGTVTLMAGSQPRGLLVLLSDPQQPTRLPQLEGAGHWLGALLSDQPLDAAVVQARLLADPETVMALAQHPALYRLWRLAEGSDES